MPSEGKGAARANAAEEPAEEAAEEAATDNTGEEDNVSGTLESECSANVCGQDP